MLTRTCRILAFAIILPGAILPGAAMAGRLEDSIVSQLAGQGFTEIQINRTWLGRSRIVARSKNGTREIVVNPATGAILRDYWEANDDQGNGGLQLVNPDSHQNGGRDGGGSGISIGGGRDDSDGHDGGDGDEGDSDGGYGGDEGGDDGDSGGEDGGGGDEGGDDGDSGGEDGGGGDEGGDDGDSGGEDGGGGDEGGDDGDSGGEDGDGGDEGNDD